MQKKVVGVLGGMGPDATVDFMSKVITTTNKNNAAENKLGADQDHIRMLIDHNPKVPNRNDAIKGISNEDVGAHLAEMAARLENAGADFLVMVCNTAHAFKKDIEKAVDTPFISIIDEVTNKLKTDYSSGTKIGVMAAQGCLESELYQTSLKEAGLNPVVWTETEIAEFMSVLYKIKAGDIGSEVQQDTLVLANKLIEKDAEVILAGCTEIPLVLSVNDLSVPILASTDLLVERVIAYSLEDCLLD